ncbi:MAG TPA: hypothetical protein VJA21_02615 [Verrucomicrobiae bacterium]
MSREIYKTAGRLPFVLLGIASLVAGVWGGLVRLPMNLPLPGGSANWITYHGPLMVCGFLGTVIALERAVGLKTWWIYLPPVMVGAGSVLFAAGMLGRPPLALITVGSVLFWLVTLRVVKMQPAAFTMVMSAGALAWVVGNALWWFRWPINRVVVWWVAFLALTILGERLDLSRFQKPSKWSLPLLCAVLCLFVAGLIISAFAQVAGERLLGAGVLAMALWLVRFDIARRAVKNPGLPRFMALSLLAGYGWLAVSGVLVMFFSPLVSGLRYDSALHSFFLGFVFSMIFAHAPVIFPAVLVVQPVFSRRFYAHVLLLEAGLMLRVGGDLVNSSSGRQWGAVLSAAAVALFLLNTVTALVFRPLPRQKPKVASA